MNPNRSFFRKNVYLAIIVVLLFPIAWLAKPSALDDPLGGKLSQLRREHQLGQSDLGEIDPASETIRLATLGLRGIAVSMLWSKANHYKKVEDWTAFRATLEQLSKLQPYFIRVWQYQAWNLTYNVSVELDDVRDRYYYVRRGIEYLKEGIKYNRENPILLSDLGWFIGNKIGRADERKEYRRLFKADDDFHNVDNAALTPEQRDNWLVSKAWYERAVSAVDQLKRSLGQKNPTTFYAAPAMSQINYGDAIEDEGTFGARARAAWKRAAEMWQAYGNREMRSSRGLMIRLADLEKVEAQVAEVTAEIEAISPGIKEKLEQEGRDSLTDAQREMWESLPENATDEQHELYRQASELINVTTEDIAARIARDFPDQAARVRRLTTRLNELTSRLQMIRSNRDVSNYAYWETRTDFEQTDNALQARELAFAARRAFQETADLYEARNRYEQAFDLWAKVLEQYPELPEDTTTGGDIADIVNEYADVLEQLDLSLMDDEIADKFPLWEVLQQHDQDRRHAQAIDRWLEKQGRKPRDETPDSTPTAPSVVNPADAFSDEP
jgi:hypothetical protein